LVARATPGSVRRQEDRRQVGGASLNMRVEEMGGGESQREGGAGKVTRENPVAGPRINTVWGGGAGARSATSKRSRNDGGGGGGVG